MVPDPVKPVINHQGQEIDSVSMTTKTFIDYNTEELKTRKVLFCSGTEGSAQD